MTNYPIVQVKTPDGLWLHGLFLHNPENKKIFINIHGTASNFYEEYFIEVMSKRFLESGISMLSTNNRGTGVYDAYQKTGAATEIFKDSVVDIDTWIEFALEQKFEDITLSGHSLGTEKVVYYMNKGKHKDKVKRAVLLAPADSPGSEPELVAFLGENRLKDTIEKAVDLIKQGKGDEFLPRDAYGAILPKTATAFMDVMDPDSEISKALPFRTGRLEFYSKINVPILAAIGDQKEYTVTPIKDALELMRKENQNTKILQLKNCNHDFEEHEEELNEEVLKFIRSNS